MNIQDITPGESWGCRFRTTTFLDSNGKPVEAKNIQPGEVHPGEPGEYTSIGVIQVRDIENQLVQLQCVETLKQFTVEFENCWDIDTIEWTEQA